MSKLKVPTITLNTNTQIPAQGFGVFKVAADTCEQTVLQALAAGYRHIDTAAIYFNEVGVGKAIANSGIPREEIFVTSKLWINNYSYEGAKAQFKRTLERLELDYLDLYLIHWPFGDWHNAYRALEELYHEGKVKAIGVSNFDTMRMADLLVHHQVVPAVNQLQINVFNQMSDDIAWHQERGIAIEAWGPLLQGNPEQYTNPTLLAIAAKHNKTVAQVVLRWHYQRNVIAIPKTSTPARMEENINIFDFELDAKDLADIAALETYPCPTTGYLETNRIFRFRDQGLLKEDIV